TLDSNSDPVSFGTSGPCRTRRPAAAAPGSPLLGSRQGQTYGNHGAAILMGSHSRGATVQLGDATDNCEAQAYSRGGVGSEPFESMSEHAWREAGAIMGDWTHALFPR